MKRRFGIKNGCVIDLQKKISYPIIHYHFYCYPDSRLDLGMYFNRTPNFYIITKKQTFLREGLYIW